ncbi:related to TIM50-mitochondrial inner membrane import translocase subunit [Ustilago bromivora]|uniref:Related to TIM50-mitochondrial inner membrane import translocase subunit n=1 Tax=Ustilago bromivora TaxID=307758 RepID=A0A1K0G917_9BASI|nr:related to TIM50-mitochondrial inner membrane import translocase subunit [Ustilago bromivora]
MDHSSSQIQLAVKLQRCMATDSFPALSSCPSPSSLPSAMHPPAPSESSARPCVAAVAILLLPSPLAFPCLPALDSHSFAFRHKHA